MGENIIQEICNIYNITPAEYEREFNTTTLMMPPTNYQKQVNTGVIIRWSVIKIDDFISKDNMLASFGHEIKVTRLAKDSRSVSVSFKRNEGNFNKKFNEDFVIMFISGSIEIITLSRFDKWYKPNLVNLTTEDFKNYLDKLGGNRVSINVAKDFSETPGGRYKTDGPFSGEAFKEILKPKLEEAISKNVPLEIDLDGGFGYTHCFLDEAFGWIGNEYQDKPLINSIRIKSEDEPHLIDDIFSYIFERKYDS
jgi:hypothetical protein